MFISLTLLAPVQVVFFFFFFLLLDSVDSQIRPRGCGMLLSARERCSRHPTPVPDQRGLLLLVCFAGACGVFSPRASIKFLLFVKKQLSGQLSVVEFVWNL